MPYWMQRKQSSFWGLSFKSALALQLVPSQQLLKVTASSHRGVTQTFFRLFSLPRKLPACSLLKQLGKFSPPGITQMLRNWQLLQEKNLLSETKFGWRVFSIYKRAHLSALFDNFSRFWSYWKYYQMICFALSKWDEILQEETILSAVNTIIRRGMKSWSAFPTITMLLKQNVCWNRWTFFTKYIIWSNHRPKYAGCLMWKYIKI